MLAYITYFIVTIIIHFVQHVANLAAAGRLVVGLDGRLPARYIRPVVLKDAWARIEAHGRELRHMGAHGGAWTRTDCTHGRD